MTMEEAYQMPMVQNLRDNIAGRTWLTKLDTILDYYQVHLDQDSLDKTAFCSPRVNLVFTCMAFSLVNMSVTFQHGKTTFYCLKYVHSSTNIDDVLIYLFSWVEHLE